MSTEQQRANEWIVGRDTGASSKAIWAVMMGLKADRHNYPLDSADLGRCLRLLEAVPEWKPRLGEMAAVSEYWAALVRHWSELERLYRSDTEHCASACYVRMKEILDPIHDRDPNVIRMGSGAMMRFGR